MSESSDLDTVCDIFPTYPRSDLAARFLCAKNVETLIEELFLEQQSHPKEYDVHVYQLKDMFPKEPLSVLASLLQMHKGDVLKCIDALTKPELAHRLAELTGISLDKLREKIRQVKLCTGKCPTNIKNPSSELDSRVLLMALTEIIFEERCSVWSASSILERGVSEEEQELKLYILAEPLLRLLNYRFLRRALLFFKNDLSKVLEVASMFTEAKLQSLTLELEPKANHSAMISEIKYDQVLLAKPGPQLSQDNSPLPKGYSVNVKSPKFRGNVLDLHGHTVAQAVALAELTAVAWWNEEREMRISYGKMDKLGAQAQFVNRLVIVTGRGLHSVGGPKIRSSVVRRLTKLGFLLDEDVGLLIIKGKKSCIP